MIEHAMGVLMDHHMTANKPPRNSVWMKLAASGAALFISVAGIILELDRRNERREEAQYRAAQNDIDGLNTYLRTCRQCEFKDDAQLRLAQHLYGAEIRSAGFGRAEVEK